MNYKRMNKASLISLIEHLNQELASKNTGLQLQDQLIQSLKDKEKISKRLVNALTRQVKEYQTNHQLYPIISNEESMLIMFFRTNNHKQLARCLELVLDMATLYTDIPIDSEEKDLLIPLRELKDGLNGHGHYALN